MKLAKEIRKTLKTKFVNLFEKSNNDTVLAGYVEFKSEYSKEEHKEPVVSLNYVLWLEDQLKKRMKRTDEFSTNLESLSIEYEQLGQDYSSLLLSYEEKKTECLALQDRLANVYDENRTTYISDTDSIHCIDGEFVAEHSDGNILVWDCDSLMRDLPYIVRQVAAEVKNTSKMNLKMLQESLNEIK